ncbi:MAG: hypothetical protein OQJ95_01880 [Kangiella sp.]|nr:hypothetical protein [Kangiella sp.]MCW9029226.1 hypothetical protein [Kangiella sp.]
MATDKRLDVLSDFYKRIASIAAINKHKVQVTRTKHTGKPGKEHLKGVCDGVESITKQLEDELQKVAKVVQIPLDEQELETPRPGLKLVVDNTKPKNQ